MATTKPRTTLASNPQELELKLMLLGFTNIKVYADLSVDASAPQGFKGHVAVVFQKLGNEFVDALHIEEFTDSITWAGTSLTQLKLSRGGALTCVDLRGNLEGCPVAGSLVLQNCRLDSLEGLNPEVKRLHVTKGSTLGSLRGLPLCPRMGISVDCPLDSCFGAPIKRYIPVPGHPEPQLSFTGSIAVASQTASRYNKLAALVFTMPEASLPLWAADKSQPLLQAWAQMRLQDYMNCNEVFRLEGANDAKADK